MGVPSFSLALRPLAREILASFIAAASSGAFLAVSAVSAFLYASFSWAFAVAAPISTARTMLADLMCPSFSGEAVHAEPGAAFQVSELVCVLAAALPMLRVQRGL